MVFIFSSRLRTKVRSSMNMLCASVSPSLSFAAKTDGRKTLGAGPPDGFCKYLSSKIEKEIKIRD